MKYYSLCIVDCLTDLDNRKMKRARNDKGEWFIVYENGEKIQIIDEDDISYFESCIISKHYLEVEPWKKLKRKVG